MAFLSSTLRKSMPYVTAKLTGAGLSFFLFFTALLFITDFDLYEFSKMIDAPFYGYGMICSMFIDWHSKKTPVLKKTMKFILYILAGSIIFLPMGWMEMRSERFVRSSFIIGRTNCGKIRFLPVAFPFVLRSFYL